MCIVTRMYWILPWLLLVMKFYVQINVLHIKASVSEAIFFISVYQFSSRIPLTLFIPFLIRKVPAMCAAHGVCPGAVKDT